MTAGLEAPHPALVVCAYCHTGVEPGGPGPRSCDACGAAHHAECWEENRGCAVYGCRDAPVPEPRRDVEIPVSFWGRESKACPVCGVEILAAAIRCRACGTSFDSASPMTEAEFQERRRDAASSSRLKGLVVLQFALCLVPFTALVAALVSHRWRQGHGRELARLPGFFGGLSRLSLAVGLAQTGLVALAVVLWVAWGSR